VDAAFMSVLAFATAPWVVAALYLLLRDGYYPVTWLANLLASSVLYLCGGLLWNVDWTAGRGLGFAFTAERWPPGDSAATFRRVLGPALLLMGLVSAMILQLLWLAR
jgi:hypothetical protein